MPTCTFLGKSVSGRFTIPSGIVTVTLDTIERLARSIPQIGVLTTKSIGPGPRDGNPEPILAQVGPGTLVNAVGLANPGCDAFAEELSQLRLPPDKFLLVSIFGGTVQEFQRVARTLSPFADGLELNFSCPHARGYGQEVGGRPELAAERLAAVKAVTHLPVLAKLSPNVGDLRPLAKSLLDAGADGFTVINTWGPKEHREPLTGQPILSNRSGGVSGTAVKAEAIRCLKEISAAIAQSGRSVPIIGMGGVSTAQDVRDFEAAGASIIGVGTALSGMDTGELGELFLALDSGRDYPLRVTEDLMAFQECQVDRVLEPASDLRILWARQEFRSQPGQFVFLWLPGRGEKPFAPAFDSPLSLVVRRRGPFTSALFDLRPGDPFYVRGPYGVGFRGPSPDQDVIHCLVGGGTGIAPLLLLAKELRCRPSPPRTHVFLGGRTASQVYFLSEFEPYGTVHVATEDGSLGFRGLVTQLLEQFLSFRRGVVFHFYNCGPELMERAAFTLEQRFPRTGIETSVERYMKCGIGVCGVCALDGWRTCVDGPVLDEKRLAESRHFGCCHRTKSGHLEAFSSGSHGSPAGLASDPCPGPGTPPPSRSR